MKQGRGGTGRRWAAAACLLWLAGCRGGGAASDTTGFPSPAAETPADAPAAVPGDVMPTVDAVPADVDATPPAAADAAPTVADVPSPPADAGAASADATPSAVDAGAVADAPPAPDAPADGEVPIENREQGERPGPASAEALARRLLAALLADDPAPVTDLVFPVGPFSMLKDLPDPAAYQRRLVRWFEEDLHAERARLGPLDALEFRSFRLGRCEWVPKWGEGNLIPYWSCRRSKITAFTGRREVEVEIRVLINWGQEWYVTHLGPVRR